MVGLQAHEHGGLGAAVELLEVDADGAVEGEEVGADGLAGGVGHAHPRKAQAVAQRAVDQQVAQGIAQPVQPAHARAGGGGALRAAFVGQGRAHAPRQGHEVVEQAALQAASVFHADHHAGEQPFEDPRRREVVGRADLFQVDGHGGCALGAVHHVAAGQPLRVAEDVLADPGQRHVGQHLFAFAQVVELLAGQRAVEQRGVGVHHPLGLARGAAGEEHGGHIVGAAPRHLGFEQAGVAGFEGLPLRQQFVQRAQAGFADMAQAARVVVPDALQQPALGAGPGTQFQQLVDLFLVFDEGPGDLGVLDGESVFGRGRVLVQRHGDGAQTLRGQHAGVQARAVVTDDHGVVAAAQAGSMQATGQLPHQARQLGPGGRLPDAVDLLAQGRRLRPLRRVVEHPSGEGRGHRGVSCRVGVDSGQDFDVALSL